MFSLYDAYLLGELLPIFVSRTEFWLWLCRSGKPQNQLTLTNGKYFELSWLCSECNDPLFCDSNNQNACSQ